MNGRMGAAFAGALAGVLTTAVMVGGRKSGLLSKTLDRDAVEWIDRQTGSRDVIGETGTSVVEFANHIGASALFGYGYGWLRERVVDVSPLALGAIYGVGLYVVNIALIAPRLGITAGERAAGPRLASERLATHLLQSTLTALLAERLRRRGW